MNLGSKNGLTFITVFTLAVVLLFSQIAAAATVEEYKKRIDRANTEVDKLLVLAGAESGEIIPTDEKEIVAAIKRSLPLVEKIEMATGTIEDPSRWIHEILDKIDATEDLEERTVLLTSLSERLTAVSRKLDELITASSVGTTKDEDKQKLAEILRREEYQKPEAKQESMFQRMWREFWQWFEKTFPSPSFGSGAGSGITTIVSMLQILLYVLIFATVGFLVYKFLPFFSRRFGKSSIGDKSDRVILGERISKHESSRDLFAEAERLAQQGELRAAIRKGYIAMLCELSDRHLIALSQHKTNRDYLRDVRKRDAIFMSLSGLTRKYEQNWYGLKETGERDWEEFRQLCKKATADWAASR